MEYTIAAGGGSCGEDQWAVLDSAGAQVGPCYATQAEAQDAADGLNGGNAEESNGALATSPEWHAWVIPGDSPSSDGREFAADGGGWRDLPLPVMLMTVNDWGHDGARLSAQWQTAEWRDGLIYAEGIYDTSEDGAELRRLVDSQMLRWVSCDVVDVGDMELYELLPDGTEVPYELPDMLFFGDRSHRPASNGNGEALHDAAEEEPSGRIIERYLTWKAGGFTVLPFPAYPNCVIAPIDVPLPDAAAAAQDAADNLGMASRSQQKAAALAVTAAAVPVKPPAAWFADPGFGEPETDERLGVDPETGIWAAPLTITADGRVFGHLAPWEECHIGYDRVCMTAPPSATGYAYFLTGELETAEGDTLAVGQITLSGGHPDLDLDARHAVAHYDDTRSAVADVNVGEDRHGVWLAGALRPGVTEEQLRVLRASPLSGDWRPIGTGLELVAALAVNVPGYPIARRARVASGRQRALVSAGASVMARIMSTQPMHGALAELARRVDILDARTEPLRALAAAAMRQSVRGE